MLVEKADVVVIGGGCIGASIGLHLAKKGVQNVVILEKAGLASGATSMSSGYIRLRYWNETTARIALKALRIFRDFNHIIGGECGFVQSGVLWIANEQNARLLEQNAVLLKGLGANCHIVSPSEIRDIDPRICIDDISLGLWEPESGYADPVLTTTAFAESARKLGAQLYFQTAVVGMTTRDGKMESVVTERGVIRTETVVNAAGIWGKKIGKMVDLNLPIRPTRVQGALFRRPRDFLADHPVVIDYINRVDCRPFGKLTTLVGGGYEEPGEKDPDNINLHADWDGVEQMAAGIANRFPRLSEASYHSGYAYLYDNTPDRHPILDQVGPEGFYCAVGMSGHGFKESPVLGEIVAELIARGRKTGGEVDFFNFSRFNNGKLICSPFMD